jgi:hypothetical protein
MLSIVEKYRLPAFNTADPAAAAADPAPAPVVAEHEPAVDPAPEPSGDPEPHQHGNAGKTPWFITELNKEKAARLAAEKRAADAEALAQRLPVAQPPKADPAAPPAQQTAIPTAQKDFEAAVARAASQQVFQQTIDSIVQAGYREFGKARFDELSNILAATGCAGAEVIADVRAIDPVNAHKILAQIASNPEDAARLGSMDSRSRIAELIRMDVAKTAPKSDPAPAPAVESKPAARAISKAPAPAPVIQPVGAAAEVDWRSDKASDGQFDEGFNDWMKKRAARRR